MTMDRRTANEKPAVLFLPGIVTPVDRSYAPLLALIGDQIQPILKDLEVYEHAAPPLDYGLELEVEGIRRVADAAGLRRFHLVGFSGGGAASLAFTAQYPERLLSLALIEPAWIGSVNPEDEEYWAGLGRLMTLPPEERMQSFIRWHMRPGVEPPVMQMPPGPPPAWMAKRPAGMEAMARAFNTYTLDQQRFRLMSQPVYYGLGGLSTRFFEHGARTLAGLFPNMQIEEYANRSHFDPPQRSEPERFAQALHALWARSRARAAVEQ